MSKRKFIEEKLEKHVPYGAEGSGFYSDNTIGCYSVIQNAMDLVMRALQKMEIPKDRPFVIADYGTADGGTSMPLIREVIRELRKKYPQLPIEVRYEDQPVNDFKSLFLRLQGRIPGPPSYYEEFENVYVTACGTSFYSQCFPQGTVDLGFSATAMHWLVNKPCEIKDALHHTMGSDEEKKKFAEEAARNWELLLEKRAKELRKGGAMVIVNFAVDKEGQFLGCTKVKKHSMHHTMEKLWRSLVEKGVITREEYINTTFPNYYRTEEETMAPLKNQKSPVYQQGLRLVSCETRIVPCPYHEKYVKEGGDPKKHAKWYIPTTRTWSNATFFNGLSTKRSVEERNKIVDQFFEMYEDSVAEDPKEHGMDYVHCYLLVEKA